MWSYIIRRLLLMIPTLFGVTIVSFVIMQIAPGDPMLSQLSAEGAAGESSQTREAYLIQKRDLKLDKPLLFNIRNFQDLENEVMAAAWARSHSQDEIQQQLAQLATVTRDEPELHQRVDFLRRVFKENNSKLGWGKDIFSPRLMDPAKHERLAAAIRGNVQAWCENIGTYAVLDVIRLLASDEVTLDQKRGLIACLNFMVVEPHQFTYSKNARAEETPQVQAVWEKWWQRNKSRFPDMDAERKATLEKNMTALLAAASRAELFELVEQLRDEYWWEYPDMQFFANRLLGDSSLDEKMISAMILKLYVPNPLKMTVPNSATKDKMEEAIENWQLHYTLHKNEYIMGFGPTLWSFIADTQYAHMVWRLATFQFGRSALRTREPVSKKIWNAVKVSAPLMLMSSLFIYMVAIPLGILCAVNRGNWIDQLVSLKLFFLYSVPPFVAGMLFLLYLCYGDYLRIFPMGRLHSDGADSFGFVRYMLDYFWHAILPVICLSLFSLAPLAMYARTSLLEVLGQDYIRTAKAKGLSDFKVVIKHAFRNSLIPLITLFASFLPALLGGSVLIESIFNIPGMGMLGWESILLRDIPTLMALLYINAIIVMLSILMTDLLYVFVDPRISFESKGQG